MDAATLILTATLLADWSQTAYLVRVNDSAHCSEKSSPCHHYEEKNKLLGKDPTIGRVNTYFALVIAGSTFLPTEAKWGLAVFELAVIARNRQVGIRFSF